MSGAALLELERVSKDFTVVSGGFARLFARPPAIRAVDEVSLAINRGETVGIVGESGCGKTTTALLAVRLLTPTAGVIRYRGEDITRASGAALRSFRQRVQMVFQDTGSALNPHKTVRRTLIEALRMRHGRSARLEENALELLAATGLGPEVLPRHPHALSGGQRQRIGIARALAMEPELIVADEPVSALDVSLQAQIISLFAALRRERGLTLLFISHDLALVDHLCDRVVVMFGGKVVETGTPDDVIRNASHPYTKALVASVPRGLRGRQDAAHSLLGDDG